MKLSETIHLSAEDADNVVMDVAAVMQSSFTMTPLGALRYGSVPEAELSTWLQACCRAEVPHELNYPRITGLDNDSLGPDVTRLEFLAIRDLEMESLDAMREVQENDAHIPDGRIVAYAEFKYHPLEELKPKKQESQTPKDTTAAQWKSLEPPAAVHRELHEHWNNVVETALENQFGGMHCFEVRSLATLSPSHLRKGIASRLLTWIFPWADRLNVPVVLAATPPGYPLYLKHGFVPIGENDGAVECNMADWGGTGIHRHVLMVRQPGKEMI